MPIGDTGQRLILLASQPRAGSTLLQRMLGRHPAIHTASERWIGLHPCVALRESGVWTTYDHDLARNATKAMLQSLQGGETVYWEGVRRLLSHLYDQELAASGRERLLDKTPRYYFILHELRRVFPEAHILLLLRHPLAVLASVLETWVRTPDARSLAGYWHDLLTAPRLLLEAMSAGDSRTHVVRYEELVTRPYDIMNTLSAALGLDPGPDLVQYGADDTRGPWTFGDQSLAFQVSEPVADRADRWSDVLVRQPVWHALGSVYLERLGAEAWSRLGYSPREASAMLAVRGVDPAARKEAEAILAEPTSFDRIRRASEAAHARAADLERSAEERLGIVKEQERAIAAFEAAVAGRDAEITRLRGELDKTQVALKALQGGPTAQRVWRAVLGRKE